MNRAVHSVVTLCRVLGISPIGYYAWRNCRCSAQAAADAALTERAIHAWSDAIYGAPRIHEDSWTKAGASVASGWPV